MCHWREFCLFQRSNCTHLFRFTLRKSTINQGRSVVPRTPIGRLLLLFGYLVHLALRICDRTRPSLQKTKRSRGFLSPWLPPVDSGRGRSGREQLTAAQRVVRRRLPCRYGMDVDSRASRRSHARSLPASGAPLQGGCDRNGRDWFSSNTSVAISNQTKTNTTHPAF